MSAYGYKRTYSGQLANVCFTPNSGHSRRKNASVPKSGFSVSALPPKADIETTGLRASSPAVSEPAVQSGGYEIDNPKSSRFRVYAEKNQL